MNMTKQALLAAGLIAGLSAGSTNAATILTATEDNNTDRDGYDYGETGESTDVQGSSGTSTTVSSKRFQDKFNGRTVFFKFDLSSVSPVVDGPQATLTLTATNTSSGDYGLTLYALDAGATGFDWAEDTIHWENSPALATAASQDDNDDFINSSLTTEVDSFSVTSIPSGGTLSFTFLNWDDYRQSDDSLTLILVNSGPGTGTPGFSSSEASSNQPALTIDVPEPSSLALLALGGLCMARRRRD